MWSIPNAGHGVIGLACMRDVVFRFIDAATRRRRAAVSTSTAPQRCRDRVLFVPPGGGAMIEVHGVGASTSCTAGAPRRAPCGRSTASAGSPPTAASPACSARTAPARRRRCASSPGCSSPTPGSCPVDGIDVAHRAARRAGAAGRAQRRARAVPAADRAREHRLLRPPARDDGARRRARVPKRWRRCSTCSRCSTAAPTVSARASA